MMVRQIKNYIRKIIFKFIKPEVITEWVEVPNTYAQAGEDAIIHFLFSSIGNETPSYIDIGSNKPYWGSNTFLFYQRGAKGIAVEPDPNLFSIFKSARPNDISLNVAVGFDNSKEADFFIFDEPSLNTMSEAEAIRRDKLGQYKLVSKIKVEVIKLEKIIQHNFSGMPDFISLDVEGIDFEILKSFDFDQYPVPVWIVETIDYTVNYLKYKNIELIDYMKMKGYFVYADTYINTVFVNSSWYNSFLEEKPLDIS